eukprot:jgi/Mesen1/7420/ME000388S06639
MAFSLPCFDQGARICCSGLSSGGGPLRQKDAVLSNHQESGRASIAVSSAAASFSTSLDISSAADSPSRRPLEAWFKDAIYEVVRNLQEAPFLHLVFDSASGSKKNERHQVSEELFTKPETWTLVKKSVLQSAPDGIILVHKLDGEEVAECIRSDSEDYEDFDARSETAGSSTDVWGVVVQAKSSRRHACYILKTTRVASLSGACTKFTLTRARCFGPTLHKQIENSWLL